MKKIVSWELGIGQRVSGHIKGIRDLQTSDAGPYGSKSTNMGVAAAIISQSLDTSEIRGCPFVTKTGDGFAFDTLFYNALINSFQVSDPRTDSGTTISLKSAMEYLIGEFRDKIQGPSVDSRRKSAAINELSHKIQALFAQCYFQPWPTDIQLAFDHQWDIYESNYGKFSPAHVRSSSPSEDNEKTSGAGQNLTDEAVAGKENIKRAIIQCMASSWAARSMTDRVNAGIDIARGEMPVCVVNTVKTVVTGVGFGCDNITGNREFIRFELVRGMGTQLVGAGKGTIPASYIFSKSALKRYLSGDLCVPPYDAIISKKLGSQTTVTYSCEGREGSTRSQLLEAVRRQGHHDYNFDTHPEFPKWAYHIIENFVPEDTAISEEEFRSLLDQVDSNYFLSNQLKVPTSAELALLKVVLLRFVNGGGVQEDPCDPTTNARFPVTDEQAMHIALQIYVQGNHFKELEHSINERDTEFSMALAGGGDWRTYAAKPANEHRFELFVLQNRKEAVHSGTAPEDYSEIAADPHVNTGLVNLDKLFKVCDIPAEKRDAARLYMIREGWIAAISEDQRSRFWEADHHVLRSEFDRSSNYSESGLTEQEISRLEANLKLRIYKHSPVVLTALSYADNATGTGPIHIVRLDEHMDDDMERCPEGAIVFVDQTSPDITRALDKCNGIISMSGGATCHGSLVAGKRNSGAQHIAGKGEKGMIGACGQIAGTATITIQPDGKKEVSILMDSGKTVVLSDGDIVTVDTTTGAGRVLHGEYVYGEIATSRKDIADSRPKLTTVGAIAFDDNQFRQYGQLFEEGTLSIKLLRGEFVWMERLTNKFGVAFHPKFLMTYQIHIDRVQSELGQLNPPEPDNVGGLLTAWHNGQNDARQRLLQLSTRLSESGKPKYAEYISWLLDLFEAARGYESPRAWTKSTILQTIGTYGANCQDVNFRLYDSKPEELVNAIGATSLEAGIPKIQTGAVNPDFGHRGTGLFLNGFQDVMELEFEVIFDAMRFYGRGVIKPFAVFVRTPQEFAALKLEYAKAWVKYVDDNPQYFSDPVTAKQDVPEIGSMIEIGSNTLDMRDMLAQKPLFVSVGSNDMKASLLAMCRILAQPIVGEQKEVAISILKMFAIVAASAEAAGCPRSCCGNAPSINPALAKFLALLKMDFGIKTSNMGATMMPIRDQELEMVELVKARLRAEGLNPNDYTEKQLYDLITIKERIQLMEPLFVQMLRQPYMDQAQQEIEGLLIRKGIVLTAPEKAAAVEERFQLLIKQGFDGVKKAMIEAREQGIMSVIDRVDKGEDVYEDLPLETVFRLPVSYLLKLPVNVLGLVPQNLVASIQSLKEKIPVEQREKLTLSLNKFAVICRGMAKRPGESLEEKFAGTIDRDLIAAFQAVAGETADDVFKLHPDITSLEQLRTASPTLTVA